MRNVWRGVVAYVGIFKRKWSRLVRFQKVGGLDKYVYLLHHFSLLEKKKMIRNCPAADSHPAFGDCCLEMMSNYHYAPDHFHASTIHSLIHFFP